jgi:hypothetical protein
MWVDLQVIAEKAKIYKVEPPLSGLRLTVPHTGMQFLSTFNARAEL